MRSKDLLIEPLAFYLRHSPITYKKSGIYHRLLEPLCLDRPRVKVATTSAGTFSCNIQDFVQRYIWLWGNWEPVQTSYVRAHLRPGQGFVDVGANVGWFTVLAGNLGARVTSFEPLPSIFEQLEQNVALNGLSPRLVRAAISDHDGEIPVYRASDVNLGLSTTEAERGYAFEAMAPVHPLATALDAEEVGGLRLMKIDTEGVAIQAVRGLLPLLPDTPPDFEVLMELDIHDDPSWPGEVARMFSEAGFHAYAVENDYQPTQYLAEPSVYELVRCDPSTGRYGDVLFSRRDVPVVRWNNP